MLPGVKVEKSAQTKDELVITGADIDSTSRSAALIRQSCLTKDKDIRKFLDGVTSAAMASSTIERSGESESAGREPRMSAATEAVR
eukprot:CAMPEP_0170221472 /NCGR_PEP_ID=MMETSP0116_2-20130129/10425_1 /TAXON_ID=400756 /ORGANISM="Durinskia baltica, Strain CSIRO CS-38" /LENGTH=85 /DNA_ID=CAMNT_0010472153 /DNA_START=14 /DNA_END=268 /DNA_ORIENTATION=-